MPIVQKWHYICPITGADAAQLSDTLPERWARIADEVYSPEGMGVLARRILKHPDAEYATLLAAPFPSTVYDDWQNDPPPIVPDPPVTPPAPDNPPAG